jgi:hypothetical protein
MDIFGKYLIGFLVVIFVIGTFGIGFYFLYAQQQNLAYREQTQLAQIALQTQQTRASGDIFSGVLGLAAGIFGL